MCNKQFDTLGLCHFTMYLVRRGGIYFDVPPQCSRYLFILHADPCNKSYISREISIEHTSVGFVSLAQLELLFLLQCERIHFA